jgi:DNA-packaging protein gp3
MSNKLCDTDTIPVMKYERKAFNNIGRPRVFSDEKTMRDGITEYFKWCEDEGKAPTWVGIAVWFGTSRKVLVDYFGGKYDSETDRFSDVLHEAKGYLENDRLVHALSGAYNAYIAKFDLENNYGYSTKTETTNLNANLITTPSDIEKIDKSDVNALRQAYLEIIKES